MSEERKRNMRLQGRHMPQKKTSPRNSTSPKVVQHMERLSVSPNNQSCVKECCSKEYSYEKTDEGNIEKHKEPKILNFEPGEWRKWIEISNTERGSSKIYYDPEFLKGEADELFKRIVEADLKWDQKSIVVDGNEYSQPRLVHWIGPFGYQYSSATYPKNENWPEAILEIRDRILAVPDVADQCVEFNSVLCNLYRDEKDGVAWHSDNELTMGVNPFIASVSFGVTRKFELKRKDPSRQVTEKERRNCDPDLRVHLESGSLFIMSGALQKDWLHRVPKEFHSREARINLTFRKVFPLGDSYFE